MAVRGFTLKDEERRRQITIVALAAGIFLSTLPVTNERALFSPFAETPLLGDFSPTAYAMFVGFGPGGGRPGGIGGPLGVGGPEGGPRLPAAFAALVPPTAPVPGAVPAPLPPPVAAFVRPVPPPPPLPTGSGLPGPGAGPGDALGTPGGPGPISVPPGNPDLVVPTPAVPEPATWAMLMLGFAVVGGWLRRARTAHLGQGSISEG